MSVGTQAAARGGVARRRPSWLDAFEFALAIVFAAFFAVMPGAASAGDANDPSDGSDAKQEFPRTLRIPEDTAELTLNGHGERSIFFFRIYAVGLYLQKRCNTLESVLKLPGPKRLQLHMRRELSAKTVRDYLAKRIADGTQPAEMAVLEKRMAAISAIIDSVGVLRKGDTLTLDYLPQRGTIVRVNDAGHGDPIAGDEFFHALLRIWLGERARSHELREALLGRPQG